MAEQKIGIKIADGTFYPILDEGEAKKKRLVLTTVNDNQENVQIDLYRGTEKDLSDASYVGSLLVEQISEGKSGETEIEMVVGLDDEGNLETTAEDRSGGARQSLSVSLQNLEEEGLYEVPDFSLEDENTSVDFPEDIDWDEEVDGTKGLEEETEAAGTELEEELPDLSDTDFGEEFETGKELETGEELELGEESEAGEDFAASEAEEDIFGSEESSQEEEPFSEEQPFGEEEPFSPYREEEDEQEQEEKKSKSSPVLVGVLVILALALIGSLLYLFVFMSQTEESVPPLEAQSAPEEEVQEESEQASSQTGAAAADEAEIAQETEETAETEAPAEESDEGAEAEAAEGESGDTARAIGTSGDKENWENGVWYRIRWGDTLWGISSSFYNTPWFFNEIADQNDIKNPDRIYAQDKIFIPKPE